MGEGVVVVEGVRGQIVQSPLSCIPSPDQALFES